MEPLMVLDVTCLCAQWCGTCRDYVQVFEQCQAALPSHRYRWIDIEDQADLVGDLDIETFPTLLVAHEGQVLFAGPVLPRLNDIQRLLQALAAGTGAATSAVPNEMSELALRLRELR